jgi:hypothetical protein
VRQVSKDKKKKKKDKKKDKPNGSLAAATQSLKDLSQNPLVADVVAAALVATAAALKDSKKARALADEAGEQLGDMAKGSVDRGSAMWDLALDVGRRTLQTLAAEATASGRKTK